MMIVFRIEEFYSTQWSYSNPKYFASLQFFYLYIFFYKVVANPASSHWIRSLFPMLPLFLLLQGIPLQCHFWNSVSYQLHQITKPLQLPFLYYPKNVLLGNHNYPNMRILLFSSIDFFVHFLQKSIYLDHNLFACCLPNIHISAPYNMTLFINAMVFTLFLLHINRVIGLGVIVPNF